MNSRFARGAQKTPRYKLAAATPHIAGPAPIQFAIVPLQLSFWGNQTDGDCVTAEEAFAKACHSPEIFVPEATAIAWATRHGVLNGAVIADVLTMMQTDGFVVNGRTYDDGAHTSVDYSNETVLQSAIANGPVKIGIDANALPHTAGTANGWSAFGGTVGQFPNLDHCVSLCGYGPTPWLAQQLGVVVPPGAPANGYLLFTWNSIGFVDHVWVMSCCGEAWLRNPTTITSPTPVNPNVASFTLNSPVRPNGTLAIRFVHGLAAGHYGIVSEASGIFVEAVAK